MVHGLNTYANVLAVFVPFLGDFFSIGITYYKTEIVLAVFVPFLGDFFSILMPMMKVSSLLVSSFRPLSRGLLFNNPQAQRYRN